MDEKYSCPNCGSIDKWHFSQGDSASSVWDRFDKTSPDEGHCDNCGFRYSEHVSHSLREQLGDFRREAGHEKINS